MKTSQEITNSGNLKFQILALVLTLSMTALTLMGLLMISWKFVPLISREVPFPPLKILFMNLKLLIRWEGGYVQPCSSWIIFISMSSWFYFSGNFILRKIMKYKHSEANSWNESLNFIGRFSCDWLTGSWFFAMVWFVLGSLGYFTRMAALGMTVSGCIISLFLFARIAGKIKGFIMNIKFSFETVCSGLIVIWLLSCSTLLAYPQFYWDTLMMNMAIPEYYSMLTKFTPNIFHPYTYFAQNNELLTVWPLLLNSKGAAYLLNWGFFVATIAFIYGWVSIESSSVYALCAVIVFLSSKMAPWLIFHIKNDLQVGIFLILSWWALCQTLRLYLNRRSDSFNFIFLAGLFAGISFGHKFIAVPPILVTFLAILTFFFMQSNESLNEKIKICLKYTLLYLSGFFLSSGPWLIRNFLISHGNPFYPFLNHLFHVQPIFPWHVHPLTHYRLISTGFSGLLNYGRNLLQFHPEGVFARTPIWWGPLGFLGCMSLLCLTKKFPLELRWICFIGFISWVFSLLFSLKPVTHLGPLIFVLSICFGISLSILRDLNAKWIKLMIYLVIGIGFFRSWLVTGINAQAMSSTAVILSGTNFWHYLGTMQTDTDELASIDEMDWVYHFINKYSKSEDQVIFVGSVRPYGIHRKSIAAISFAMQPLVYYAEQSRDARDLKDRLLSMGVRQIVYEPASWKMWVNNQIVDDPYRHNIPISAGAMDKIAEFTKTFTEVRFIVPSGKLIWLTIKSNPDECFGAVRFDAEDSAIFPLHFLNYAETFIKNAQLDKAKQVLVLLGKNKFIPQIESRINDDLNFIATKSNKSELSQ